MRLARAEPRGRAPRALVRTAQLLLTVLVTWLILERLGPGVGELARTVPDTVDPRWEWIAASCLLLAGGYAGSACIWGRMVQDLGGPTLPAQDAIRIYLVANLARYVPGKLWQIAGLALLARTRGVPAPLATAAAVTGQAMALAGATLIGLLTLRHTGPPLDGWAPWGLAGAGLAVAVVAVSVIFRSLLRLWLRWAPVETITDVQVGALTALRWLVLYTLNWGCYSLSFWVLVHGLSLPGGPLEVAPAFAAAYVLGYLALFAPAGLGVREGFLVALLAPVLSPTGAAFAAVAARVWTTTVEVVPAGVFWLSGVGREPLPSDEHP